MRTKFQVKSTSGLFIILYHLLLLATLPLYLTLYGTPSWGIVAWTPILVFISGIGITGGYHRLYSHRTYQIQPLLEPIVLFFSTLAAQGSVIRWAYDHRMHHAFVDTEKDPYSIKKGFWYAHILWLFEKERKINEKVIPDLIKRPILQFQHNHYGLLLVLTNLALFYLFGWLYNDFAASFVFIVFLRIFLLHHFTWFINSLAHTWGDKPFSEEHSAVNNYIISFLTFGEGYHNFHHTFANDYRNGIRWYQFDPTKWTIWLLEKFGLAWGLKRTDGLVIRKKILLEKKEILVDRLKEIWYVRKEELEATIQERSEKIVEKMTRLRKLIKLYKISKKKREAKEILSSMKKEIKELRRSLKKDWKEWSSFSRGVMRLQTFGA